MTIRTGGDVVGEDIQHGVYSYFALYAVVFAAATLVLSLIGLPFVTAISSVAATLNGVGPGLGVIGAVGDYHLIPPLGKLVLSMCMLMGRLELITICVLFVPSFWKHS
jgi:trk system potassium uptake protein TrkH